MGKIVFKSDYLDVNLDYLDVRKQVANGSQKSEGGNRGKRPSAFYNLWRKPCVDRYSELKRNKWNLTVKSDIT